MEDTFDAARSALAAARSLGVIVIALVLGLALPPPAWASALVPPTVVVLLYTSFRGFSLDVVSVRSGAAVGLAIGIGSLLLPALAALVGPRLLPETTFLGLFVVIAAPTTVGSAIVWTRIAGGDVALATLVATSSVALSPLVVPALFAALLATSVAIDPVAIGVDLATVLAGGLLLWWLVPERALSAETVDRIAILAVAVLVYVAVGTTGFGSATPWDLVVVCIAVLAVHATVLGSTAIGGRLLGLSAASRRAVFYGAGMKNLGVSLLVAASIPAAPVLPIVGFYVAQQLLGAFGAELGAVPDSRPSERPL